MNKNTLKDLLGFKDNSPFRNSKSLDINSNNITMDGVSTSLLIEPNNDKPIIAPPNSGHYIFPNSTKVKETRLDKMDRNNLPSKDVIKAYLETLSPSEQSKFITSYKKGGTVRNKAIKRVLSYQDGGEVLLPTVQEYPGITWEQLSDLLIDVSTMGKSELKALGKKAPLVQAAMSAKEVSDGKPIDAIMSYIPGLPTIINKLHGKEINYDEANRGVVSAFKNLPKAGRELLSHFQEGGAIPVVDEVPRSVANVEVEGGETVLHPTGELNKFEGASHAQGGIAADLEAGSKVFSKFSKAPKELVYQILGKETDKKYSYADLSKRFPTEKLQKVLETTTDKHTENSAQIQLARNLAMLQTIFHTQEMEKQVKSGKMQPTGLPMAQDGTLIEPVQGKDGDTRMAKRGLLVRAQKGATVDYPTDKNSNLKQTGVNTYEDTVTKTVYQLDPKTGEYSPIDTGRISSNKTKAKEFLYEHKYGGKIPKAQMGVDITAEINSGKLVKDVDGILKDIETGIRWIPTGDGLYTVYTGATLKTEPVITAPKINTTSPIKYYTTSEDIITDNTQVVTGTPFKGNLGDTPKYLQSSANTTIDYSQDINIDGTTGEITNTKPFKFYEQGLGVGEQSKGVNTENSKLAPDGIQGIEGKVKKPWYSKIGVDSKLAGAAVDIAMQMMERINVSPVPKYDNRLTPMVRRFQEFDSRAYDKAASLQIANINASNLPESVKQARIAEVTAKTADGNASIDLQNQQRYEGYLDNTLNKIQTYADNNLKTKIADDRDYRQRKAALEESVAEFRNRRKTNIYNTIRGYMDYKHTFDIQNQYGDNPVKYNPITGKITVGETKVNPLEKSMLDKFESMSLPEGMTKHIMGQYALLIDKDGKVTKIPLTVPTKIPLTVPTK